MLAKENQKLFSKKEVRLWLPERQLRAQVKGEFKYQFRHEYIISW